jgi:hypothetical protein
MKNIAARIVVLAVFAIGVTGPVMAQETIRISSAWGDVTATLADNEAARSLAQMLPLTIEMSDHLRQEKTGNLPSALPQLWSTDHFVIYYRSGRVPSPGIIILGQVKGDVSIFDRPESVTVTLEAAD